MFVSNGTEFHNGKQVNWSSTLVETCCYQVPRQANYCMQLNVCGRSPVTRSICHNHQVSDISHSSNFFRKVNPYLASVSKTVPSGHQLFSKMSSTTPGKEEEEGFVSVIVNADLATSPPTVRRYHRWPWLWHMPRTASLAFSMVDNALELS